MTFQKQAGRCMACQQECRRVLTTYPDGPMQGFPRKVGEVTPIGTLVRFLLLDGSSTDLTFCVACAGRLQPEHFTAIWDAQLDYTTRVWDQNKPKWQDPAEWAKQRRADLAHLIARPIVAVWTAVTVVEDLAREAVDRRVTV